MSEAIATDSIEVRRSGGGYAAQGPGYYVWDEDLDQVIHAARELSRGGLPARKTGRMLVIRAPGRTVPRAGASEALDA